MVLGGALPGSSAALGHPARPVQLGPVLAALGLMVVSHQLELDDGTH